MFVSACFMLDISVVFPLFWLFHLWSLLLVHKLGPHWKSLITLFAMLHLLCVMNSPLNFVSLISCSLHHLPLLSHMAVHHLHCHHLHLLSFVPSFILTLRLGSLANPFYHRPFLLLPNWLLILEPFNVYSAQWLDLFAWCVSRLSVGFQTHFKFMQFCLKYFVSF